MRGSDFIFDGVNLLYYKCHKINFKYGASYIDSPDQTKKKKAIINPKNINDRCFQYAVMVALNYGEMKWIPERISNFKPFMNKYNRDKMKYSSKIVD